jgi:trk system potassium uptake protein TrkH
MPVYDAICHAFGTIATGGFSPKNASIGFYHSPLIEYTVVFCMFISAVKFSPALLCFERFFQTYLKSEELRWSSNYSIFNEINFSFLIF